MSSIWRSRFCSTELAGSLRPRSFSIASGWTGRAAVSGGAASAALGLATHFLIALGAASVYFLTSRRFPILWKRPVPMGILFGAGFYVFMNFVVIPLSAFPFESSYPLRTVVPALAVHMFLIGLPIALSVQRFGGRPHEKSSRSRKAG